MSHIANVLKVSLRRRDPRAPVFEVFDGLDGWRYHERRSGRITSSSEAYASKGNAKRAAYAQAVLIPGSRVKVVKPWNQTIADDADFH